MERFDDNDSEDERELDEQKNKKENDKKIDGNPSFSQSIINKQENTGIREKVNMAGQSNNPSFNIIGQNNIGLHNLDNNNDNSSFVPQESNNQNIQVNNFGNGVNSNNNQINYNQNYNVQNNNIANQEGIPSMPGGGMDQKTVISLVICGACLAVAIVSTVVINKSARRR